LPGRSGRSSPQEGHKSVLPPDKYNQHMPDRSREHL